MMQERNRTDGMRKEKKESNESEKKLKKGWME